MDGRALDDAIALRAPSWCLEDGSLVHRWRGRDFAAALAFVVAVGQLAEDARHHPDVDIRWNTVTLRLVSHDVGVVTERDLALAEAIDRLELDSAGGVGGAPS